MARTRDEKRNHLRRLTQLVEEGIRPTLAVARYMEETGLTARQAWRDVRQVKQRLARRAVKERGGADAALGMALARLSLVYRSAFEAGDFRAALKALDLEARLLGLYDRPPAN